MKQVFEQYGSAVVAVLVATMIYLLLLQENVLQGKGFSQVLGEVLEFSLEAEHFQSDAFKEYMSEAPPQISKREDVWIRCKERVQLTDLFVAKSSRGETLAIYLQQAWTRYGEQVDLGVAEDRTSICVEEAGVYWVQLFTIDDNGKETSVITKLLVNER